MKEIIDDLKDLSGVLGACMYHGQKGVLEANLPAIFSVDKLSEIGKILIKIQAAGRMNFHDLTDVTLQYDESVILVRELEKNLIVFLLCDPDFNQNLVAMSLNLLQQELKNQQVPLAESGPVTAPPKKDEVQATVKAISEEVVPILAEMKAHLPKIMGPMADIIFEETVDIWKEQGNSTVSELSSLVKLLAEEIGSADKIISYKEMIAPAIKKMG